MTTACGNQTRRGHAVITEGGTGETRQKDRECVMMCREREEWKGQVAEKGGREGREGSL